jgi:hypothetical protein
MLGLSVASLVAWSVLEALRISFVEMHLLLLLAAVACLIHITRTRDLDERVLLPLRNRDALRAARRSRKHSRQQRLLQVTDSDELELSETGQWHVPDATDEANGFVRARGSHMIVRDTDIATRDAILDLLSDTEVASVTTSSTARDLHAGDEFIDLEHVELGVRRASGVAPPPGYVLPRCAVSDATWHLVVSRLEISTNENT